MSKGAGSTFEGWLIIGLVILLVVLAKSCATEAITQGIEAAECGTKQETTP